MNWETYDPTWLVELARSTRPDIPWLPTALARCTKCCRTSRAYVHFVNPDRANKPESDWQFREHLYLHDPIEGNLIVDVLEGRKIGGIEFYDRLFSNPRVCHQNARD